MTRYRTPEDVKASGRLTPMMAQYLEAKEKNPDAILFFRLGDFYEMFFEDALTASEILEITLTSRDKGEEAVPMCGVPHFAASSHIARLVSRGFKVAVCEQTEDPQAAKKLVAREVVKVVTPGLATDDEMLEARAPSYLMAVAVKEGERPGFAYADVTTGEFRIGLAEDGTNLTDEISRIAPRELLYASDGADTGTTASPGFPDGARLEKTGAPPHPDAALARMAGILGFRDLTGVDLDSLGLGLSAALVLLEYVKKNLPAALSNIAMPGRHSAGRVMFLGETTRRNLEIFRTMSGEKGKSTLLSLMDRTRTAMGGRELRRRMQYPLLDPGEIRARLDAAAEFASRGETRRRVRELMREVDDLERLTGRLLMGNANARDLVSVGRSLTALGPVREMLADSSSEEIAGAAAALDTVPEAVELIGRAVADSPPAGITEGGIIRDGFDGEIDELRGILKGGRAWIAGLQAAERERTGIQSLKIGFNRVFGYYIEVGRTRSFEIPPDYERRQTLANAERYVTPGLKEMEAKVLGAEERLNQLELKIFREVAEELKTRAGRMRLTAAAAARIDVYAALADLAVERRYVKPSVADDFELKITGGRHPVVEAAPGAERFVPNDISFDRENNRLLLITGPNMSGKSTILRQTALIALMAQMGSFVPAESASIGVVDRVFTRVGASDDLALGRSTFMVEMMETAAILTGATARSLLILDEIGRGTSTFDGLSIAWAVAEHIQKMGCRTLFATHYHELTDLAKTMSGVANFNVAVKKWDGRIIFLRRLVEGAVNRSYGIEVAKLAGLPRQVTERAEKVLDNLQSGELDETGLPRFAARDAGKASRRQPDLFLFVPDAEKTRLAEELAAAELETMTPVEAMIRLSALREKARDITRGGGKG